MFFAARVVQNKLSVPVLEFFGEFGDKPFVRVFFKALIRRIYFPVKILDRSRQISRYDFAGFVVNGKAKRLIFVYFAAEFFVFYNGESVSDYRDFPTMLHYVFFRRRTHKRPTLYVFHAHQVRVKIKLFFHTLFSTLTVDGKASAATSAVFSTVTDSNLLQYANAPPSILLTAVSVRYLSLAQPEKA